MSSPVPIIPDGAHCPCCGHHIAPDRILADLNTNTVTFGRRRVVLGAGEAEMAFAIVDAYPGTASLDRIYTALWGGYDRPLCAEKSVHVYACRIRAALKPIGLGLENIPRRGYRISEVAP